MPYNRLQRACNSVKGLILSLALVLALSVAGCSVADAWEESIFFTSVNATTVSGTQVTGTTINGTTAYFNSANISTLNVTTGFYMSANGTVKQVYEGSANTGGVGYKILIVAN